MALQYFNWMNQLLTSSVFFKSSNFPLLSEFNLLNGWLANACVIRDYRACGRSNCRCQTEGKLHSRHVIKYRVKVEGKWVQKKQHLRPTQVEQAKTEIYHLKGYRQLFRECTHTDALISASLFSQDELIGLYYAGRGSSVLAAESRALRKQYKQFLS